MHTSGAADGPDGALDVQVEGRFEKGLLRRGWSEGHWLLGEWRIRRRASQVGRATARNRARMVSSLTGPPLPLSHGCLARLRRTSPEVSVLVPSVVSQKFAE